MRRFLLLVGVLGMLFYSCKKESFLNNTSSTELNEGVVFADSAYTMDFLSGIYTDIGFSTMPKRFGGGGLDACSDEAEGSSTGAVNTFIQFATGTVNPSIITDDAWRTSYTNIRRANQFLKHVGEAKFNDQLKVTARAEARFLRAWYYAVLLQHYAGIPLIGDSVYKASDVIPSERNTYEECVNYITGECDAAAADLPWVRSGENYGRISKAACLTLKARVLLTAASPLFNGGGIASGEPLRSVTGYPTANAERWKAAQDAAQAVMNSNLYSLYVDNTTEPGYGFYKMFLMRKSDEMILARMQGSSSDLESVWNPPTHGVTNPGAYPYLETVNAFGMKNGLAITDPASGYDAAHPYDNRDPRFINTFTHDQSLVYHYPELVRIPVNIYIDKTNPNNITSGQDAIYKGTPTGYYVYKMLDRDVVSNWFNSYTPRCFMLMRYAEILLDFAEARNEYLGAPDQQVYDAVEAIRMRAGLSPYQLPVGLSQEQMRQVIMNEWQKEFAFEGHRFWDVRRWKIGDQTQNQQMHGTEPDKTSAGTTYTTIPVRKHNFSDKMYLWPIPQSEISKSPAMVQNPGY